MPMLIPRDNPIPALLEFIAAWIPELSLIHRMESSSIPAFIPLPLRAVYEFAGNYPVPNKEQWRHPNWTSGLFNHQDQLLPVDQLELDGERFQFIHENQGGWSCETMANQLDPPVFSDSTVCEHDESEGTMRLVCSSLAHFLTTFCLQEVFFNSKNVFCIDSEETAPHGLVMGGLNDIWVNGTYAYDRPTHSFYLCNRGLFIMDSDGHLWLAYNDDRYALLINRAIDIRRIS
jgi:hypothetical protein